MSPYRTAAIVHRDPKPGNMPLRSFPTDIVCAVLAALLVASPAVVASGCGAQAAQQDAVRTGYATELQLCIAQVDAGAKTKAQAWAEADACRADVDARYGVDSGLLGAK